MATCEVYVLTTSDYVAASEGSPQIGKRKEFNKEGTAKKFIPDWLLRSDNINGVVKVVRKTDLAGGGHLTAKLELQHAEIDEDEQITKRSLKIVKRGGNNKQPFTKFFEMQEVLSPEKVWRLAEFKPAEPAKLQN